MKDIQKGDKVYFEVLWQGEEDILVKCTEGIVNIVKDNEVTAVFYNEDVQCCRSFHFSQFKTIPFTTL